MLLQALSVFDAAVSAGFGSLGAALLFSVMRLGLNTAPKKD